MNRAHRIRLAAAASLVTLGGGLLVATAPASSAATKVTSFERKAVDSARTGPVKDMPRQAHDRSTGVKERENATFKQAPTGTAAPDTVQQSVATASATTPLVNGKGLGFDDNAFSVRSAPPDTNGAVGRNQYVQSVNTQFAVYDKATATRQGAPFFGSALFTSFGGAGSTCAAHDDGDPVVQYDKAAGRWLITQFQVTVTPYLECVAVSDTEDAAGSYHVYAYSYGNDFVDYPKIGVWPDSYAVTYNVFLNNSFTGGEVCALDRARLLAPTPTATAQKCFRTSTTYAGLLPSDLDGAVAPPAGNADSYVVDIAGGQLNSWRMHLDWTGGTPSTLTGPTVVAGTAAFSLACSGGGTCIPQSGTAQKLDSLGDRLMNRLAYRVLPTGPVLVVTHAVTTGGATRKTASTGVRWYQLVPSSSAPSALTVGQQGTYAPDATHRWLSTAAMDKNGGMAVGYSASSATLFPSIRVASRLSGEAPGTLGAEKVLQAGAGSQSGQNLARWGDYASMSVDPIDDCTLWFTTEYLTATGAFNWSTRIMSLKTGAC